MSSKRERPRVLIADDMEFHRTLVRDALEGLAADFFLAEDGWSAIELARRHRPHIALLDIVMPEVSGPEVARTLRESPELKNCEFVLLSSSITHEHEFDPLFAAVVEKPIDAEHLVKTVRRLLGMDGA